MEMLYVAGTHHGHGLCPGKKSRTRTRIRIQQSIDGRKLSWYEPNLAGYDETKSSGILRLPLQGLCTAFNSSLTTDSDYPYYRLHRVLPVWTISSNFILIFDQMIAQPKCLVSAQNYAHISSRACVDLYPGPQFVYHIACTISEG